MTDKEKIELGTCKSWTSDDGIRYIAIATKDLFGAADMLLVSKDGKTWIAHDPDKFMADVKNGKPVKVG